MSNPLQKWKDELAAIPNSTLQDRVRHPHAYDQVKHGLRPGMSPEIFADLRINKLSNAEFLAALSEALEERLEEFSQSIAAKPQGWTGG